MPGTRYSAIAKAHWAWLGPAFKGLSDDLEEVESAVAAGGGGGTTTITTDYHVYDGFTGTWETGTDTVGYVIGTRFTVAQAGNITALRYYLSNRAYDGQTIQLGLFPDAGGAAVATKSLLITASTPIGWVDAPLDTPVAVTAGQVFKAATTAPVVGGSSMYATCGAEWTVFSNTGPGVTASQTGGNGWFNYGTSTLAAPGTASSGSHAYGVDVTLQVTSEAAGARRVVSTYYTDTTAATAPRPTSDTDVTVLWFNTTGTALPANAAAGVDKAFTV